MARALWIGIMFCVLAFGWTQSAAAEKIRVGYCDYEGFIQRNINGIYVGYGCEYLDEIAKYTGWEYEYVFGTWEECCARLASGAIDLLPMAEASGERMQTYDLSLYPMGTEAAAIYVLPTKRDIYYEDFPAFSGLTVGLMAGNLQNQLFDQYMAERGATVQRRYYASNRELHDALYNGEVDAILNGTLDGKKEEKLVAVFAQLPVYFMVKKGDTHLLQPLNRAMQRIWEEKPHFGVYLQEKYYAESAAFRQLRLTRQDAALIQSCPTLRIACNADFSPLSYCAEASSGQCAGAYVDMVRCMLDRIGIGYSFFPVHSAAEGMERIRSGEADLLLGGCGAAGTVVACGLRFTEPYIYEKNMIIGKKGGNFNEETEFTVAVLDNYVGLQRFLEKDYPLWRVRKYATIEACLSAVRDGQVDATLQNANWVMNFFQPNDYPGIGTITALSIDVPISIGVAEQLPPALTELLNKSVRTMSEKEKNGFLIKNTFGKIPEVSLGDFVRRKRWEIALAASVAVMLLALAAFYVKRKKTRDLLRIAYTDRLTGLRNFEKFILDAEALLRSRNPAGYAVAYLDIEKFKYINEALGAARGDEALRSFAAIFSQQLRGDEVFARIGGDRFIALLRCNDRTALEERLRDFYKAFGCIRGTILENRRLVLTSGVYQLEAGDCDVSLAVDRANLARGKAKGAHENRIDFYDRDMHAQVMKEKEIESIMENALANGEFLVYLQPKYELKSRAIIGAEALVRWRQSNGEIISPNDFIPIFERNGFIVELDFYMLRQVCALQRKWADAKRRIMPIAVNFSRLHVGDVTFVSRLQQTVSSYGVGPSYIEIEMTESAFVENDKRLLMMIHLLKQLGFCLAMDDFGTGYSSLNLLREVPFDILKLDKSFLQAQQITPKEKILISNIIHMAKELEIRVVAEGIETQEQEQFLTEVSCDMGQGYYFSRPVPVQVFEEMLENLKSLA